MLLENIRFLITQNEEREILENVDLKVEDREISEIGDDLEGEEKIDCSGKIVLPGLINCHTHVSMSILRGIEDDELLDEWLFDNVMPAEEKMDEKHVRTGAKVGIIEMLKSGTTCFNDMYGPEAEVAEVVKELGIRATLGQGFLDKERDTEEELNRSKEFISEYLNEERIKPIVNPHAIYTCSREALEDGIRQSEEFDLPIHIHVSETEDENSDCLDERGGTPVQYLDEVGVLDRKVIAAHCTHLTDEDLELMADKNVGVAHCPVANLKLGSGIAPVPEMLERGIHVGIGTDGPASNNSLNMFQEMKTASIIQKNEDPREMDAQTVLDMATINGAEILGLDRVGKIEEGWKADLIAVEIDESMRPCRRENIVSHLVFSDPEVAETIVEGELLVRDGELVEDYEMEDFEELSRELW